MRHNSDVKIVADRYLAEQVDHRNNQNRENRKADAYGCKIHLQTVPAKKFLKL